MSSTREERFRSLYADHYDPVLRFARRRTDPASADDVVAETFLVAWRRLDDVPRRAGETLPWLYAVARNCLLNTARGETRQRAVSVRLARQPRASDNGAPAVTEWATDWAADVAGSAATRVDLFDAWRRLSPEEQEVLALALWEDLTSPQAGRVLGISAAAYRVRLSRARRALALHLDQSPSPISPTPTAARAATTSQERV